MADLPDPRPYTPMLIGAWWPAAPIGPADAAVFWSGHMDLKQREAEDLDRVAMWLGENNSGHTAQDMLTRLAVGRNRLLDVAADCRSKSEANERVAHAVNQLRETLAGISSAGNDAIDDIRGSDGPAEAKAQRINAVVIEANRRAGNAAMATSNAIVEASQRMLDETAQRSITSGSPNVMST